jgi:hypothetical protein
MAEARISDPAQAVRHAGGKGNLDHPPGVFGLPLDFRDRLVRVGLADRLRQRRGPRGPRAALRQG